MRLRPAGAWAPGPCILVLSASSRTASQHGQVTRSCGLKGPTVMQGVQEVSTELPGDATEREGSPRWQGSLRRVSAQPHCCSKNPAELLTQPHSEALLPTPSHRKGLALRPELPRPTVTGSGQAPPSKT